MIYDKHANLKYKYCLLYTSEIAQFVAMYSLRENALNRLYSSFPDQLRKSILQMAVPVSYTHLDVYKRQPPSYLQYQKSP